MDRHPMIVRRTFAVLLVTVVAACSPAASQPPGAPSGSGPVAPTTSSAAPSAPPVEAGDLVVALDNLGAQDFRPWLTSSAEDSIWKMMGDLLISVDPVSREFSPASPSPGPSPTMA